MTILPATAALPAVAIDPATAVLATVAAELTTPALATVAAEPATAVLATVAAEPATAELATLATEPATAVLAVVVSGSTRLPSVPRDLTTTFIVSQGRPVVLPLSTFAVRSRVVVGFPCFSGAALFEPTPEDIERVRQRLAGQVSPAHDSPDSEDVG